MIEKEKRMEDERIRKKERTELVESEIKEFNRMMSEMKQKCEDLEKAKSGNGADLANTIINGIANGVSAISNTANTTMMFRRFRF